MEKQIKIKHSDISVEETFSCLGDVMKRYNFKPLLDNDYQKPNPFLIRHDIYGVDVIVSDCDNYLEFELIKKKIQ